MPLDNPKGGFGYAAEFQSSALPWVTSSVAPAAGSPVQFQFPKVTRFITVMNRSASGSISFGFTRNGVTFSNNKFILMASASISLEVRIKDLWLQDEAAPGASPYTLFAGLTNIDRMQMPFLSGTLSDGVTAGWLGVG